jgi:hypothetical protein
MYENHAPTTPISRARRTSRPSNLPRRLAASLALLLSVLAAVDAGPAAAAPNPVVVKANGDVVITGDNGGQNVEIREHDDGRHRILYRSGGFEALYYVDGVERDLIIKLKGGDDELLLDLENRLEVGRDVVIDLGSGTNRLEATVGFSIGRNLRLIDGSGSATIDLRNSDIAGSTTISLGTGMHTGELVNLDFGGTFKLTTGSAGQIDLSMEANDYNGSVTIRTGNRSDALRLAGVASVNAPLVFDGRTAVVDLRGGNDRLDVEGLIRFNSRTTIRLGSGHDRLTMFDAEVRNVFSLRADGGNDLVNVSASRFDNRVALIGGGGQDQLAGEGNTFQIPPRVTSFEIE